MRSPQIGMLATPGTDIMRNFIVQYAIIDRSIMSYFFDLMPIFSARLVDDSGCSITGMPDDCGSAASAICRSSETRRRASITSSPSLKISRMSDRPRTDFDRITSSPGVPRSTSSIGIVISSSISAAVIPGPWVWISTLGGANSGKTSIGIVRSCSEPNTSKAADAANNKKRNFRLVPMIQPNIAAPSSSRFLDQHAS
jgi:hypothetical protein